MTTPPWKIVTPEQYKQGWMELRGVTPIHHDYIQLGKTDQGNVVVRNPELQIMELDMVRSSGAPTNRVI